MIATGIGSLPFRTADKARALLARFELPFLPELPNLERDDLMLRRPFAGLLEGDDEPRIRAGVDLEAPVVLGPGVALLEATSASTVKVQLAGPRVLREWVRDARGRPLGETAEGKALVARRFELYLRALLRRFSGRKVIVFLDEPGLDRAAEELAEAVSVARAAGAWKVGVHDCGPGFQHAAKALPDFLSFDLALFRDGPEVRGHLGRGGALAVGAIPTTRDFEVEEVVARLRALPAGSLEGALVTPACGTALLGEDAAGRIHEAAIAVAARVSGEGRGAGG